MTVHEKFVEDMDGAGINTEHYQGRFYWEGPAVRSNEKNGPTLQDITRETTLPLQWDSVGSDFIVYPIGKAKHQRDNLMIEDAEDEQDNSSCGYAAVYDKPKHDKAEADDED